MHIRIDSLIAAALLGIGGIAAAVEPAAPAASAATSASLMTSVVTLIGEAPCDNQGQCHVVGVGAKACGGPSGFRAWSDKTTDPTALRSAVTAQSQAAVAEMAKQGLASDCAVTPEPSAAICRPRAGDGKKVCQLGQGGVNSAI